MTAGLLPGVIFLTVTGCLVLGEPLRRVSMVDCSQPIGCTNSVPSTCFFSPECRKRPIKSGSDIILGRKREVDCSKPAYCDRCIPVSCYFDPECKKQPITTGAILGTLGKRCLGNMGTLG
ncbi:uncharacterized protein LOC135469724 [Liolophura sinensis]|uniref:uncharacterized protein LOC135469724 n=1 Tax=Liolophura sinensis TaxID=3198878 RepID=UPI003158A0A7